MQAINARAMQALSRQTAAPVSAPPSAPLVAPVAQRTSWPQSNLAPSGRSTQSSSQRLRVALAEAPPATSPNKASSASSALPQQMVSSFSSLMDDSTDVDAYDDGVDENEVEEEVEVDESLKIANLGLSEETMLALAKRNVHSLFAVQKMVFQPAMEGQDMICRAKTGSGKTLAFALPVVENLLEENRTVKPALGRKPRCVVLAPTRELANQVAREFESVCPRLKVASFYGGVSIGPQIRDLERGIDVAVGTPGRIIDLIERGCLKLDKVRFAILDEADQMLDMGFEEDMEKILGFVPVERQTMLFSATQPKWVQKVARRFQRNPVTIDLVGEENTGRLAEGIRLMVMQCEPFQKLAALQDVLALYAAGGKAIIFVNTKARADEVASSVSSSCPCEALHGDISQAQREKSLQAFRDGKVTVLVATDVAARGLDVPSVELVVHYDVPQDNEAFLHRSGRTGRAGNKGTAVVLFGEREASSLGMVLRATKVKDAELVGAADPAEVMQTAARNVLGKLDQVDAKVIDFFTPAAERLLASDQPARVLAAALASMSGFRTAPQPRSLLNYQEGLMTLRLLGRPGAVDGWNSLLRTLNTLASKTSFSQQAARLEGRIGKFKLLEDAELGLSGAAFDLPVYEAEALLAACSERAQAAGMVLDRPRSISIDVSEMLMRGGRGGAPRADRYSRGGGGGSWGDRGRSSGGGGGSWGDRGRSSSGGGGSWGDRGRSSGGGGGSWGDRDRGSASSSGGGSWGDRGARGGDFGGRDRGYADRRAAPSSGGGYDSAPAAPRKMAPRTRSSPRPVDDGWGQW